MSPQEFVLVMLFGFLTWIVMHQGSHGWYYTQDIREGHRRYAGNSSPLLILIMGFEQYIFFLSIIWFVYMMGIYAAFKLFCLSFIFWLCLIKTEYWTGLRYKAWIISTSGVAIVPMLLVALIWVVRFPISN
jgi:hypothetical protein